MTRGTTLFSPASLARTLVVLALAAGSASGDTLLQIYEKAAQNDPEIREAEANRLATRQNKPIARGSLLPQVDGTGDYTKQNRESESTSNDAQSGLFALTTKTRTDGPSWTLNLRQSLFRWDEWVRLSQASKQATQADVDYEAAQQSLIIRISQAYFNVLAAEDTLASEQAAKDAIGRQLEQAQKRFEVGLIAITDVQEAQAAYDQALAAEILAKRTLANQQEALRAITDEFPGTLAKPAEEIPLLPPSPENEDQWVDTAMQQNRTLLSSQIDAQIAKDDISLARTGHLPTVDFVASTGNIDTEGKQFSSVPPPGSTSPVGFNQDTDRIGVQVSVPIFSGGTTSAQVQQAVYLHRASRERLERTARETERQTRDSYLGVITDIARVRSLKQSLESARTALKATEAGYEVGTRTTVDVLTARQFLFNAETNYLRSRYDYLLNGLLLKEAAGTLAVEDLAQIDALLTDTRPGSQLSQPSADQGVNQGQQAPQGAPVGQ
ncbi:MAG: TolC family outer membrane protein [Gammaproteobacteria bacterium]|nr:TolC family outer membrane protein [Gammaproteobacteria bacterium]